jgi:hypothetical protein
LLALYGYFYRYKAAVEIFFKEFLLFSDVLILGLSRLIITAVPPFGSKLVLGATSNEWNPAYAMAHANEPKSTGRVPAVLVVVNLL